MEVYSRLRTAIADGNWIQVDAILNLDSSLANAQFEDFSNATLLHYAIERRQLKCISVLISHRARIEDIFDSDGRTPIELGCQIANKMYPSRHWKEMLHRVASGIDWATWDGIPELIRRTRRLRFEVLISLYRLIVRYGGNLDHHPIMHTLCADNDRYAIAAISALVGAGSQSLDRIRLESPLRVAIGYGNFNTVMALRMLGATVCEPGFCLFPDRSKWLTRPISVSECLKLRYMVWFATSLLQRLIIWC